VSKEHHNLTGRILELLEKDPGQAIQKLANELKINRTFLAGYLKALENEGKVKSKKIGPARVYFCVRGDEV
jgi:predicted transcriptional regulator